MALRTALVASVVVLVGCGASHGGDAASDGTMYLLGDTTTGDGGTSFDGLSFIEAGTTDTLGTVNGACSTLMNTAEPIVPTTSTAALPAPMGGTIADGWYYLVASTTYTDMPVDAGPPPDVSVDDALDEGDDDAGTDDAALDAAAGFDATTDAARDAAVRGPTRQESMLIVAGSVVYAIGHTGTAADVTTTYTLHVASPAVTLGEICPAMAATTIDGFDATSTTLALHDSTARRVDAYVHQ